MSSLLSITLFLLSALGGNRILGDDTGESFFKLCPPTRCSNTGPIIRFPFRLNTEPTLCGLEGFELSCSGDNTVFHLPFSGNYYVKKIRYLDGGIYLTEANGTNCPLQDLLSLNRSASILENSGTMSREFALVKCEQRVETDGMVGPIDCLRDDGDLVYVMDAGASMDKLPPNCSTFRNANIGTDGDQTQTAIAAVEKLTRAGEFIGGWDWNKVGCFDCEKSRNYCGFNRTSNGTICSSPRPQSHRILVIIGTSVGGTILVAVVIVYIYKLRKSDNDKETQLKIEKFLAEYRTLSPTRYAFKDIKKIARHFRHKLGQGGYGSVYRGKLQNGVPVAVKLLENSKGNGEEFINEVAIVSQTHHFNVVRLLGFCYEGTRCALVYEFMPNGSLERFILSTKAQPSQYCPLSWEKMQQIATGIARGIEYLHQGCNQRILHFDIKPHNILLDHNFNPKISDFGLAKLCSKDQSVLSMTAARGTAGYIAPELFSRNFGVVSYKSDVFSYGMLLLEMVGCRKNIDVTIENQSQIYFPEWIYDRMSQDEELGLQVETDEDKEVAKKLAIVALWCIQWSPANRPSMTNVIQMLESDLRNSVIPPKPFASSDVEMGSI